jgi:hypothetical protein
VAHSSHGVNNPSPVLCVPGMMVNLLALLPATTQNFSYSKRVDCDVCLYKS